jgi:hypothetical protein
MKNVLLTLLAGAVGLLACRDPKDVLLPRDLEELESIKPAMQKLTPQERDLAAEYIARHTVGAKLGGLLGGQKGAGIPEGMTLGRAIEEQRKFAVDRVLEKAKLQANRDAALKSMQEALTVTLASKEITTKRGLYGLVTDDKLRVTFGCRNNTKKDISGFRGYALIEDFLGEELSEVPISNDATILAGQTATWVGARPVHEGALRRKDRRLAELSNDKCKVVWRPEVIVFSDGTKLNLPVD